MVAQVEPPIIEEQEVEKINSRIADLKRARESLQRELWDRDYEIKRIQKQQDTTTIAMGLAEAEIERLQAVLQTALVI